MSGRNALMAEPGPVGPGLVPLGHWTLHEVSVRLLRALAASPLLDQLRGDDDLTSTFRRMTVEEVVSAAAAGDLEVLYQASLASALQRIPTTCWSGGDAESWNAIIVSDRLTDVAFGAAENQTGLVVKEDAERWIEAVVQRRSHSDQQSKPDSARPVPLALSDKENVPRGGRSLRRWVALDEVEAVARRRISRRTGVELAASGVEKVIRDELARMLAEQNWPATRPVLDDARSKAEKKIRDKQLA